MLTKKTDNKNSQKNTEQSQLKEDLKFADRMTNLPEMPEAVKNIAKQFMDSHNGTALNQSQNTLIKKKTGLTVSKQSLQKLQSDASALSRNPGEQSTMNRSFSQKFIKGPIQDPKSLSSANSIQNLPKVSARVSELASQHLENHDKQQSLQNQVSATNNSQKSQVGFNNLAIKQGLNTKNVASSSQSALQSNGFSSIPSKYQDYLPNIIKKKINDANSSPFNFNPREKLVHNKKDTHQRNLEFLQAQLRSDVSYLKESAAQGKESQAQANQPTILTTGDKAQDELLEVTLGYKNLGKSLIDLPQSIEVLHAMLKTYDQSVFGLERTDQEERVYEQYLYDNFKPLDILEQDQSLRKEFQMPNLQLKQYINSQPNSSRFLNLHQLQNHSTKNNQIISPGGLFNVQDKQINSTANINPDILNLEKQPRLINTRPDLLALVQQKILKKFGSEAFSPDGKSPRLKKYRKQANQQQPDQETLQQLQLEGPKTNNQNTGSQFLNQSSNTQSKQKLIDALVNVGGSNNEQQSVSQFENARNGSNSDSRSPIHHQKSFQAVRSQQNLGLQMLSNTPAVNLGNPTSRQDALLLIVWFEKMLKSIQNELSEDQKEDKMFPLLQLVMNICVKELSRQVSVQCLERGFILQKVFDSYVKLIDLIHKNHKSKRRFMKQHFAEKLDKYITVLEDQISGYKDQIDEYKLSNGRMKQEINDYLWRLKSGQNLVTKFKKKCFNAQKDYEGALRKFKFLEKQNEELKLKVSELSERLGEEVSELDDNERKRMMFQIEQEIAEEQDINFLKNELDQDEIDINNIPDKDIIKEEELGTDMGGFDLYLKMINAERTKEVELQTEKVTRRHMKVGVTSHKIGIMRDRETFIDPRMFQGEGTQQYRIIDKNQSAINIKVQDAQMMSNMTSDEGDESESSYESDEIEEIDHSLEYLALQGGVNKNLSLKIRKMPNKRSRSNNQDFNLEFNFEDLDEQNFQQIPQFGKPKSHKFISVRRKSENTILELAQDTLLLDQNEKAKDEKLNDSESMSGQLQKRKVPKEKRKQRKPLQETLMDLFSKRIKKRVKEILQTSEMRLIREQIPEFAQRLEKELIHTAREVGQINTEIHKKEKQVRQAVKISKRKEKNLRDANQKVDNLELENYNLREQIAELMRQLDEYKLNIQEILKMLDTQSLEQTTINEIRRQLLILNDKIFNSQQKLQQTSIQDDEIIINQTSFKVNNLINSLDASLNIQNQNDNNEQFNKDPVNEKFLNRPIGIDDFDQENNDTDLVAGKAVNNISTKKNQGSKLDALQRRAITRIQAFQIGRKKFVNTSKFKGLHPAYQILKKIQRKDKKKLKDLMPRKMLLRVIHQVYQERGYFDLSQIQQQQQQQQLGQSSSLQQALSQAFQQLTATQGTFTSSAANNHTSLVEWIYDSFMQKYGLKNVAERKFVQLIQSCIVYQDQVHRVRLFGRFIEAYDELPVSEYNKYLEMTEMFIQQILNFKIEDDSESILLPLNRAIDYFKLKFEQRFLPHAFSQRLHQIEKMRVPVGIEEAKVQRHLKGVRDAVDYDWFTGFIIDNYIFLQEEREQQIKDIYLAVDVNNDGFMTLQEFQMLMKVFHYKSDKEIQRLFDEYAISEVDPSNPFIKYLNLEQFTKLATEKEYFTPKIQYAFCNSQNVEKDFAKLQSELSVVSSLFRARLTAIEMNQDFEMLELLENFQNSIRYPFSPRVGWLCYRVIDEVFKRLYLSKMSDYFMPVDMKQLGFRMKPSQQLFNTLPLNFFDTQQ